MKTFYKLICDKCGHIIEKSSKEVQHTEITTKGKKCDRCNSIDINIWRSKK